MSFDREQLETLVVTGPVARVVVADARGSVPREVGAAMLVTPDRTVGTIGGGALEFEAIRRSRKVLSEGGDRLDRVPLGPAVGQCCGGSVTLLTEVWDVARLSEVSGDVVARPLPGMSEAMPLATARVLNRSRAEGMRPMPGIVDGWMVEPVLRASRDIWVWGAGHVGRAIVSVLAPLPGVKISWVDSGANRFPAEMPVGVTPLIAANPADLVTLSEPQAEHLVLTYSHALDLELCHRMLSRPHARLGLIGSATKWARFRKRLVALGHASSVVDKIVCPIGDPSVGKHPQQIAISVAADVITEGAKAKTPLRTRA